MFNRIELGGMTDIKDFVKVCESVEGKVELVSKKNGYRVNGKSIVGAIASLEFDDLWVYSEEDIYSKIERWVITDDSVSIHS
jgi:Icc-related predicted phosphoesterase